jgi:AcrR family transcriptional regulator
MGGAAAQARTAEGTGARNRLLEAAAALIIERRSIDISLADIAGRSGLNAALVKYYFGGKNGLLVALARRDAARALGDMNTLLRQNMPASQKMRLHLRGIMNTYRRSPYLNRLLHELLRGPDRAAARDLHDMLVQPVFDCQQRILNEGLTAGEFAPVDHRVFYLSATGACDQFMHTETVLNLTQDNTPPDVFRDRYIGHVVDMVMASLTPKPEGAKRP